MTRLDDTKAYYKRGTDLIDDLRSTVARIDPQEVFTNLTIPLSGAAELVAYVEALEADRAALLTGFRWHAGIITRITDDEKQQVTRAYAIAEDEPRVE
jgi:hypothetical protein